MYVRKVSTQEELNQRLSNAENLVAVNYCCGGGNYEDLASEWQLVLFLKVDKNDSPDMFDGITVTPTFRFFLDGNQLHELINPSRSDVHNALKALR